MSPTYDVVIPTTGRASLQETLRGLISGPGPLPGRVLVVDDRRRPGPALIPPALGSGWRPAVLRTDGRGPAAARNAGWRAATAPWVAFLDDDVIPTPGWRARLAAEIGAAAPAVGAIQGRLRVPLPAGQRPTDRERDVRGLEEARWATADMAARRAALLSVGGFDERFRHAYREDTDLGLRLCAAGWEIRQGDRRALHPVGRAPWWVSLARQRGNFEDPLMRALHGRRWRARADAPAGRLPRHALTAVSAVVAVGAEATRNRRVSAVAAGVWALGTAELALARTVPGPRTPREVGAMLATSAAMPFAATAWRAAGWLAVPQRLTQDGPVAAPAAVLLDRDGTLIRDVPYNGDPTRVEPMPGAREALRRLRAAGIPLAVVSNQSGVARGLLSEDDVRAINARVDALLGPFDAWLHCPHAPEDACACRKPSPGMLREAARRLGVAPERCVMIGDIGADIEAAAAAGAEAVMVPTSATRREEVTAAARVAPDLAGAVGLVLAGAMA